MNRMLLLVLVLVGCGAKPTPVEPLAGHAGSDASSVPVTAVAPEPTQLELVEGTPATLPDGTLVDVKHVMYAHLADSKNLSNCTLVLTNHGETKEVGLVREHGSNPDKAPPGDGLGWRFTLVMADPYQRPSRAIVQAQKIVR